MDIAALPKRAVKRHSIPEVRTPLLEVAWSCACEKFAISAGVDADPEKLFDQYIAMTIDGELNQLLKVFSDARRSAFGSCKAQMGLSGRLVLKAAATATRSFVECTSMKLTAASALRNACSAVRRQKPVPSDLQG
jgi:hypothetical protein